MNSYRGFAPTPRVLFHHNLTRSSTSLRGKITYSGGGASHRHQLAERVSLSVAPCHRRLRELERTGAIRGYRAIIDPAAVGLGFEVLVQVTMDREDASTITEFERRLAGIPEVRHAERLFGDPDYLVRVATGDLVSYQALRDEKLATLPGVQRLTSTIVMNASSRTGPTR